MASANGIVTRVGDAAEISRIEIGGDFDEHRLSHRLTIAFAQDTADAYQLSRQAQDDYTLESLSRAKGAIADGAPVSEAAEAGVATPAVSTMPLRQQEIDKLGLFAEREATFQPRDNSGNNIGGPQVVAKYYAIDEQKVNALPEEKIAELQRNGMLGAVLAHNISLLNWSRVINRALRAQEADAVQQPQGGSDGPSLQI